MPGDSLIAYCILPSRRCVGSAEDCICPDTVDPKAANPVNKPLAAVRVRNCADMPQLSQLHGEVASFRAIWGGRFTVPKVLGSMVRSE
jgi:hypothetical protein